MLKKVEKWSWIYIRNRINTKFNQFYVYGVTPCPCLPRLVDIMVVKNINVKIKKTLQKHVFYLIIKKHEKTLPLFDIVKID